MGEFGSVVSVKQGLSDTCLAACVNGFFDILCIEADRSYKVVQCDIQAGLPKMKPDGPMVFNGYVLHGHLGYHKFGVVRAVNERVLSSQWRVAGFFLQRHMSGDIALRRVETDG